MRRVIVSAGVGSFLLLITIAQAKAWTTSDTIDFVTSRTWSTVGPYDYGEEGGGVAEVPVTSKFRSTGDGNLILTNTYHLRVWVEAIRRYVETDLVDSTISGYAFGATIYLNGGHMFVVTADHQIERTAWGTPSQVLWPDVEYEAPTIACSECPACPEIPECPDCVCESTVCPTCQECEVCPEEPSPDPPPAAGEI